MMSETVVTVDPNRQPSAQPKPAAQPQGSLSWVKFNIGYFQTIPGILKLIQLVSKQKWIYYFLPYFFTVFHALYNFLIYFSFFDSHILCIFTFLRRKQFSICVLLSEN